LRVTSYSSSPEDKYKIVAASNDTPTHADVWEVEVKFREFLNSELNRKLQAPTVLPGRTASSTLVTAMDIKAGLDAVTKMLYCPCRESNLVVHHYVAQTLY
jgi:hypothetical protein